MALFKSKKNKKIKRKNFKKAGKKAIKHKPKNNKKIIKWYQFLIKRRAKKIKAPGIQQKKNNEEEPLKQEGDKIKKSTASLNDSTTLVTLYHPILFYIYSRSIANPKNGA